VTYNDCFTVDVCLDAEWLANALDRVKRGGISRVTFVVKTADPHCTFRVQALGGGDHDYNIYATMAGDFPVERPTVWRGAEPNSDG